MRRFAWITLLAALLLTGSQNRAAAADSASTPRTSEVAAALEAAARANRVPSVLLKGLAWTMSRWRPDADRKGRVGVLGVETAGRKDADRLRSDWRYNIEQGTKALVLAWNRAPIIGNGHLDDGRNILECWFYALGRYGAGKQGEEANRFANSVLDAVASGGDGAWTPVRVTRPSAARLAENWKNLFGPPAPWHFGDVPPRPAAIPVVSLAVPYVHQVYDPGDDFDGSGSCGPSSMLMVLAWGGKIQPKPIAVRDPMPRESRYGALIQDVYKQVCEPGQGAIHAKMLRYLRPYFPGVAIFYDDKVRWERVKAELDAGRPVMLGTRVTAAGHIMVARGYLTDGRLLINDPAGDREQAARRGTGWSPTGVRYWNIDGDRAVYDWDALEVRWMMTFGDSVSNGDRPEDE